MTTTATTQSRPGRAPRGRKVRFGDVTITAPAPAAGIVRQNVRFSTQALERLATRLARPGVVLRARKGIPLYSVDNDDPDVMIRTLNGRTERGYLVNGVFQASV